MQWQLKGDWPVGQFCIPTGTVLSGTPRVRDGALVEGPVWNGITLPMMPINAVALDMDAAVMMAKWYGQELWHQVVTGPGIDREAVRAKAQG
jgi:hypothetical protein